MTGPEASKRSDFSSPLAKGRVLVTGASGFIGREVVRQLCVAGGTPRALARSRRTGGSPAEGNVEFVNGHLGSASDALTGVKTIFHFAYDIRATGTDNIKQFQIFLDDLARAGAETLVHASSIVVHDGWPHDILHEESPVTRPDSGSSYRGAKIVMEELVSEAVQRGDLRQAFILRPTLVYGLGGRMWTEDLVERLRLGPVLLPKRPLTLAPDAAFGTCHIIHVEDLAAAALRTATVSAEGMHVYNLSDPVPPTWEEYYRAYAQAMGCGTVEMVAFEELEAMIPAISASGGVSLAARASSIARRMVGHQRMDNWMRKLRSYTVSRGPIVPDRGLFDLYASTGHVSSAKAESELGFQPSKRFEQHIDEMSEFLRAL